jgi:hypothetical protein
VPPYTVGPVRKPGNGVPTNNPGGRVTTDPASASASPVHDKFTTPSATSSGTHVPWLALLGGLAVLVLLVALGLVPSVVRRARRTRRLDGGVEDAWAELRDTSVDLGVRWPASRTPHETGYLLAGWFGPDPDGAPLVRPPRGRGLAPGAEDALDRIVLTLERVRYARTAEDVPGALADDVRRCIEGLEHGCTQAILRRARWLPRSVVGGGRRAARNASYDREPEAVAAGGIVDHVG